MVPTVSPYLYALGTWLFAALMNACVKELDNDVPLSLILTCRFLIGLCIFYPLIRRAGGFVSVLKTTQPRKLIFRSVLSMTGVGLTFYAIPLLPLGDATALWNTLAFFMLFLSAPILGEKIKPQYYAVCGLGFIGVLMIAHPHGSTEIIPIAVMLLAAFVTAITTLTVRLMSRTDKEMTIITWFFTLSGVISLCWWVLFAPKEALTAHHVLLLSAAGGFGTLSQLSMTRAFKALGADVMGPYSYSGILFALVLGFVFFDEIPTGWMIAGTALIVTGIHLSHRMKVKIKSPAAIV